jgi:hypothetical protein
MHFLNILAFVAAVSAGVLERDYTETQWGYKVTTFPLLCFEIAHCPKTEYQTCSTATVTKTSTATVTATVTLKPVTVTAISTKEEVRTFSLIRSHAKATKFDT